MAATQILPYVYLGSKQSVQDAEKLKEMGIEVIVNCISEDFENLFPDDFKYIDLDMEDTHTCDAKKYFEMIFEELKAVKENKTKALVHCSNSKSMAPTIVLAYMLMASAKADKYLPLEKAIKFVQGKRPGAIPNDNFMAQLIDLEIELYEEPSIRLKSNKKGSGPGYRRGKGKRGK